VAADKHERVGVFWGLLYLSAQSKVELSQREFYQDLQVRNLKHDPLDENDPDLPDFIQPD
jgi:segregation and condensation protein A